MISVSNSSSMLQMSKKALTLYRERLPVNFQLFYHSKLIIYFIIEIY